MDRRTFLKTTSIAGASLAMAAGLTSGKALGAASKKISSHAEPGQENLPMNDGSINTVETDVLVLGAGAAGCGAALAAKRKGVKVLLLDKGKLESAGSLGGGNDHFMAVMDTDPKTDSSEAVVNFFQNPMAPYTPRMLEKRLGGSTTSYN